MEVKELSRYKDIKVDKTLFERVFKVFGIEWTLSVYIDFEEIEENDSIQKYRCITVSCSDRGEKIQ